MIQANKWKNIRQIAAWASYDITNTIFFIGVVGIFFPLWVTNDIGGNDATVGFTMSAAMIVSLVLAPFFGTMTPQEWDIIQFKHLDHHLNQFGV